MIFLLRCRKNDASGAAFRNSLFVNLLDVISMTRRFARARPSR
jgi:hypothetical protein